MKKLVFALMAMVLSFGFVNASAQAKMKKPVTEQKSEAKMKKDGTPDMRYKENKKEAKAEPKHVKKDGTADKRYKENKK